MRTIWILSGLAVIAAASWLFFQSGPRGAGKGFTDAVLGTLPTSSEAGFAGFRQAALDSCMCRREQRSDQECEAILDDARTAMLTSLYGEGEPQLDGGAATACAPISTTSECYEFADGVQCVTTEYNVVGASRDFAVREVCTVEEARAVEQAYEDGWIGPDGQKPDPEDAAEWSAANDRSNAALNAMLRNILDGGDVPPTQSNNGCAG